MIKLSKKGDYAMKAIVYLGINNSSLCKIGTISSDLDISESLLRRLTANLEKSGIIESIKGRNGGIKLGKNLNEISVYDVLYSVGEELGVSNCSKGLVCDNREDCCTTDIYVTIQKGFEGILKLYTLDKIITKKESI